MLKAYIKYKRWASKAHNHLHSSHSASSAENKTFFCKLLDLPSEILVETLSWLEDNQLIYVSGLSRRFNEVALRLYLERKDTPAVNITTGELVLASSESLSGLRRAIFLDPVRSLSCKFRDYNVMVDMWELESFLRGGTVTHDLSLNFRQDVFDAANNDPIAFYTTKDLLGSLRRILHLSIKRRNTVVVLTGNRVGGVFACSPADIPAWDLQQRKLVKKRTRVQRLSSKVKAGLHLESRTPYEALLRMYFEPVETRFSLSHLEELRIQHLPSAPTPGWSLLTFNASSVDHLSLTENLSSKAWASVLPFVHLPALKYFEVSCSTGIFAADLEAFLSRHPSITVVILKSVILPHDTPPISPFVLPELTWISSTPAYLARLLASDKTFPRLTDVFIVPSDVYELPHVDITSTVDPFTQIFRALSDRPSDIHVGFDPHSIPSADDLIRCLTTRPIATGAEQALRCIVSIAISEFRKEAVDHLPRWLSYFPALHDINLSDRFLASFKRERELVQYINLILEACPGVSINPDGVL